MLPKCTDIYQCRLSDCYWCVFCPDTNPAEYTAQRHDTSDVMYSLHYKMFYGTDLCSGQHCSQSRQDLCNPWTFEFSCINIFCSKYTRENDEENINTWRKNSFLDVQKFWPGGLCLVKKYVEDTGLYLWYYVKGWHVVNTDKFDLSFLSSRNWNGPVLTKIKFTKW